MLFYFIASILIGGTYGETQNFICNTTTGNTESLPYTQLPDFKTTIEIFQNENLMATVAYFEDAIKQTTVRDMNNSRPLFIMKNDTIFSIAGIQCSKTKKPPTWPLIIDPNFDQSGKNLVYTVSELMRKILVLKYQKSNATLSYEDDVYENCADMASKTGQLKYSVFLQNQQLHAITIEIYNISTKKVDSFHMRFGVLTKLSRDDDEVFLPPPGVQCPNGDLKTLPKLPDRFHVRLDYTESRIQLSSDVYFDLPGHVTSFRFKTPLTYFPLSQMVEGSKNLSSDASYKVVHDFNTGLQYIFKRDSMSCSGVSPIMSEKNKTTYISDVFQTLFASSYKGYTLIGKRRLNNISAIVYITSGHINNDNVTQELWYNETDTSLTFPFAYRVYKAVNSESVMVSQQIFYDIETFGDSKKKTIIPPYLTSVEQCLQFEEENSSFVVLLMSEKETSQINMAQLRETLRAKLADSANVSLLRVEDFFFQPINKTNIYAFFKIAEEMSINGTETEFWKKEASLQEAKVKLNESMMKDFELSIDGFKITLTKNSLNLVPPFFTPGSIPAINKKYGYSGGAMTVLAFFMLIIGGVGGFGFAYFLWKRNRGFQYQIYE